MVIRRQRQLARRPGFTPVPNQRIAAAIGAELRKFLDLGFEAREAQMSAVRSVASRLPAPRMVRSLRIRPSKSDCPIYRKQAAA